MGGLFCLAGFFRGGQADFFSQSSICFVVSLGGVIVVRLPAVGWEVVHLFGWRVVSQGFTGLLWDVGNTFIFW